MLLQEHMACSAGKFPEKDAIVQGGRRIRYRELQSSIDSLAGFLRRGGLSKGDRGVLLLDNSPEYVVSYFAVMKSGGVVVPVSDQVMARGIREILSDCKPFLVIVEERLLPRILEAVEQEAAVCCILVVEKGDMGREASLNNNRESLPACSKDIQRLSHCLRSNQSLAPMADEGEVAEKDLAMIMYTSGATGAPKGVMLSHENLSANADSIIEYLKLTPDDKVMVVLPFYYSYGNSLLTTHTKVGGSLVLENSFHYPNKVLERMIEEDVTGFAGVPATYAMILNRSNLRKMRFRCLRYVTQAGGAMPARHALELRDILPGIEIYIMYGQTEGSARLSYLEPGMILRKAGSIGKAIPGVKLRLIKEDSTPAAPGEVGEIVAEGKNVMSGYWGKPGETSRVLKSDGLHTGDLARMDQEGFLYIVGRKSDMIKSGAHRISAREIEEIIMEIPEVAEVAVVGVEDRILGERIKACLVLKEKCSLEAMAVQAYCRRNLPPYKTPGEVTFMESLPRTGSGKIEKYKLTGI